MRSSRSFCCLLGGDCFCEDRDLELAGFGDDRRQLLYAREPAFRVFRADFVFVAVELRDPRTDPDAAIRKLHGVAGQMLWFRGLAADGEGDLTLKFGGCV